MLTRREVMLSGAAAGAVPFVPGLSSLPMWAETGSGAKNGASSAPVVFSPALAQYVASSGAVITKKIASEGPSVKSLKGAASLVRMAADHTHQNQMDAVVRALLQKQPGVAQGANVHSVLTQAFASYQQFHQGARMPDLSGVAAMTPAQSAMAAAYVSRVGLTGTLRDFSNVLGKTAHLKRSLGLRDAGLMLHDGAVMGDGLWNVGQPMHLRHVCSMKTAKDIVCNHASIGAEAALGVAIATLTLACQPFMLTAVNAELPGIGIALDAACVTFALAPVQAAAAVSGFILAVLAGVQYFAC